MLSNGARRGAMMGILRCDHPDIEAFINAKKDPHQLRHFNVSILVSDAFMQAVKNNDEWPLVFPINAPANSKNIILRSWSDSKEPVPCRIYRTVNARKLWQQIIKAAYNYAEPGVIFEDTINRMNNLWYHEYIHATNPCGEIPLPKYGACNLGAINLTQFVKHPFSEKAKFDWHSMEETAAIATRFLDNIIDISNYPLTAQKKVAVATRRIGLGLTGLADTFLMLGITYGSEVSLTLAKEIMQCIAYTTWQSSIELAKEKGSFPAYKKRAYLTGEFVKNLPETIQKTITRFGMRNSHHNTIAPTGTTSLLANNISSGIEPIFDAQYERLVRIADDQQTKFQVTDYAYALWQKKSRHNKLPPHWITSQQLEPKYHLQIQASMQPYIDNAIAKTINLPVKFPFVELREIYSQAYQLGLKGCTIFRPNPITGLILKSQLDQCCK
jgi:ribonucleoside-diphosphate reductase alpha chain